MELKHKRFFTMCENVVSENLADTFHFENGICASLDGRKVDFVFSCTDKDGNNCIKSAYLVVSINGLANKPKFVCFE